VLRPSAKINLTLRVGSVRPDGYHEVRTVLQSIAMHDTLSIAPRAGAFNLVVRGAGVPQGPDNLVWRAAQVLWRDLGRDGDPRDAHVRLDKHIPTAAGLGGGSADAAAALVGLNAIWNGRRSRADLLRLATDLGSDVPFFLVGGTVLGTGRGEELYALDDVRRMGVIVIKPSFGVGTAEAYRWHDEWVDGSVRSGASHPVRSIDVGWLTGPLALINDLEAPVANRHPAIAEMIAACQREGALAAAMTGSGSAVFGLFREPVARRAVTRLQRSDWLVQLTRTLTRREVGRRVSL
jgi:4-diphosphocytidyl-2-C-methyl-D-erythritol kinase